MQAKRIQQKIVGLIPAAGKAERISPLPCSKEIYPIGFHKPRKNEGPQIKVVSQHLIECMQVAKVAKVFIILRKGKWDIPQYLGSGKLMGLDFAYLIMDLPFGVPFTLDQAYNFVKDDIVFFGFPDIILKPKEVYGHLFEKQAKNQADVVLGLFHAPRPFAKQHMVEINSVGRVRGFQIEPSQTTLRYTWIIAVWNQQFTHFLHEYVSIELEKYRNSSSIKKDSIIEELSMTEAYQGALKKGLQIDTVIFEQGSFLDIGSPGYLKKAVESFSEFEDSEEN